MAIIKNGLVHYYFGTGKGKTTAALGLALRSDAGDRDDLPPTPYGPPDEVEPERIPVEMCGRDARTTSPTSAGRVTGNSKLKTEKSKL